MCLSIFLTEEGECDGDASRGKPLPFTRNRGYPKSASAILKMMQAIVSFTAFLSAACAPWWTKKSFHVFQYFCFVSQSLMWSVIIIYILIYANVHHRPCWPVGEFIFYILATLIFFSAAVPAAVFAKNGALVVAAVLGFLCVALYAGGTYLSFKQWRRSTTLSRLPPPANV